MRKGCYKSKQKRVLSGELRWQLTQIQAVKEKFMKLLKASKKDLTFKGHYCKSTSKYKEKWNLDPRKVGWGVSDRGNIRVRVFFAKPTRQESY